MSTSKHWKCVCVCIYIYILPLFGCTHVHTSFIYIYTHTYVSLFIQHIYATVSLHVYSVGGHAIYCSLY